MGGERVTADQTEVVLGAKDLRLDELTECCVMSEKNLAEGARVREELDASLRTEQNNCVHSKEEVEAVRAQADVSNLSILESESQSEKRQGQVNELHIRLRRREVKKEQAASQIAVGNVEREDAWGRQCGEFQAKFEELQRSLCNVWCVRRAGCLCTR